MLLAFLALILLDPLATAGMLLFVPFAIPVVGLLGPAAPLLGVVR